ncbi:MAG: glutamine amidotransferase [Pirellulales bacterium]
MFNLTLQRGYSVATMLVVAAAAIVLTALFYRRAFQAIRPHQRRILLALRIVAILLIVLLLFRPAVSFHKDVKKRRAVFFLLDTSASMSIADDATGATRFAQAQAKVGQWWEKLGDDFEPHLIEFSERATALEGVGQLTALAPVGKATSLSRAMATAAKQVAPDDIEAAFLLSDGVHNSAGNPLDVAKRLGMVVNTIGVGSSLRGSGTHRDVQVTGLECPERLLLDNKATVTASVEAVGFGGRLVKVVLEDDGKRLAEKELELDNLEGSQKVAFEITPTVKGRHTYSVHIPPAAEEKIEQNNQRSTVALVIEPGIRVLYIEGTLRAEYGALVDRFLAKDPDLAFHALVQTRPNVFLKRTNMQGIELAAIPTKAEEVNKFDVFIFGDLDSTYIKPAQMDLFAQRVREGAGLLMIGGYHSLGPGGYGGTPLEPILPVDLGTREIGQFTDLFLPVLTPEGRQHPIFGNIAGFFPSPTKEAQTAGLPPLEGCVKVIRAKPGAAVLATVPDATARPMPVMAVQTVGKGRTAVFTADTTRNWQQAPRALNQETPFQRFWGQTIRWLAGRSTAVDMKAGIVASTDKGYYQPDEAVTISAVVRNENGEGTDKAEVTAKIKDPTGKSDKVTLTVVPGPGGHYSGTFEPKVPGTFELVVTASLGQTSLTAEKLAVEVGRPNMEFERLDLDEKLLSAIASQTGGRYAHITTADRLVDQLDRTLKQRRLYFEQDLYWPPLYWLLFVGAISVEWILRKRYQLR